MAYTLVKSYLEVFEGFNLLGRSVEVKLTKILGEQTFLEDFESV